MSKERNLAPSIGFKQKHFQFKRWRRVIDVGLKEFLHEQLHRLINMYNCKSIIIINWIYRYSIDVEFFFINLINSSY